MYDGKFVWGGAAYRFIGYSSSNALITYDNRGHFVTISDNSYSIGVQPSFETVNGRRVRHEVVLNKDSADYRLLDVMALVVSQIHKNMAPRFYNSADSSYDIQVNIETLSIKAHVNTVEGLMGLTEASGSYEGYPWEFHLTKSDIEARFDLSGKFYKRQIKKLQPAGALSQLVSSDAGYLSLDEIIRNHPNKEYSWLKTRKYQIVDKDSLDSVLSRIEEAIKSKALMSMDTETTGLNIHMPTADGEADQLVGIIISVEEGQGWFFPVQMNTIDPFWGGDNSEHKEMVPKYFKHILEDGMFVGHNTSYDWKVMYLYGIDTNFVHDTQIMALMGWCNEHYGQSVGLKELTQSFLHRDPIELDDVSASGKWDETKSFADLPYEIVRLYGCADGDDTLSLYNYMVRDGQVQRYGLDKPSYRIEVQFQRVAGCQEFFGHHIDIDHLPELRHEIESGIEETQKEIAEMGGAGVNLQSSKQMTEWLVNQRHWKIKFYTKTGNPSFSKTSLKAYADAVDEEGNHLYPEADAIQRQKVLMYLKSNFIDKYDEMGTKDGYLFSHIGFPEATGRVQVNTPNYQSYSDTMRTYITPRPGYYMIDMDYSSVEYRILATLSGEQSLIDFFHGVDADYHTYQASRMFNVPYGKVSKQLRHEAKHINFGLPYGMGPRKLGANIFGEANDVNTAKASKLIDLYFQGQDKVRAFFVNKRAFTVQNHYAVTRFGRRRYFQQSARQDQMERQGGNLPIQGTAADIYKLGTDRLLNEIREKGYLGKFLISAFMHDEVLCEIDNSIPPTEALAMIRNNMMVTRYGTDVANPDNEAPLVMGGGFGPNWKDAKSTEIPVELQATISNMTLPWWDGDVHKLYDWETYKIAEYFAQRVLKYLNNPLGTKEVDVIIADYAHDLLDFLAKSDKFKIAPDIAEYGDWSTNGCPDWTHKESYDAWVADGKPIPKEPMSLLNMAYKVLTGTPDICESLGIFDPNSDDAAQPTQPTPDEHPEIEDKVEMLKTFGYLPNGDTVILWLPNVTIMDGAHLGPVLAQLHAHLGKDGNTVWKDVILADRSRVNGRSTQVSVGASEVDWFKSYARELVDDMKETV